MIAYRRRMATTQTLQRVAIRVRDNPLKPMTGINPFKKNDLAEILVLAKGRESHRSPGKGEHRRRG